MRQAYISLVLALLIALPSLAGAAHMDTVVDHMRGDPNSDSYTSPWTGQFSDISSAVDGDTGAAFNLGIDGWIILELSGWAIGQGTLLDFDVTVVEYGAEDEYEIFLSNDLGTWESVGVFGQTRSEYSFDVSGLQEASYRYLKVGDYGGGDGTLSPGVELAGVDVLNPVLAQPGPEAPLPAALWLLGSGLLGLAGLRRKITK